MPDKQEQEAVARVIEATKLAKEFHDAYERLAPQFGYETREDTKEFDQTSPNGRLMVAVIDAVMLPRIAGHERQGEALRQIRDADYHGQQVMALQNIARTGLNPNDENADPSPVSRSGGE